MARLWWHLPGGKFLCSPLPNPNYVSCLLLHKVLLSPCPLATKGAPGLPSLQPLVRRQGAGLSADIQGLGCEDLEGKVTGKHSSQDLYLLAYELFREVILGEKKLSFEHCQHWGRQQQRRRRLPQ